MGIHMLKLRTLAITCLLAFSLGAQNSQAPTPDAVNQWIRGNAIRLATPIAGHGFEDMQPLAKVVGNARIVALGEATHGTREFFQLKHRMVEFLATQMGFTIFSIEANMPEAYRLNDFVLYGRGDPAQLIKGMYFWTWDTQEVLDMVLWMREFNKSGKGRVEFTGFDMQTPSVANQIVRDFVAKNDPDYVPTLAHASQLAVTSLPQQAAFGSANGLFPVELAVGKTIHFSGYIKTENVSDYAGFWWRADRENQAPAFANLGDAAPKGTTDWKRYELELHVPVNARAIYFGALLSGSGTAWYDDLKIEIDGAPYASDGFDFGFEGPTLKGMSRAVPPPYFSRLDDHVAHSGKQSLLISRASAAANPDAIDPKVAAAEWTKVVEHLESSRAQYSARQAAAQDIEWVIQNAQVVLQCMQLRANQVTRDASMAANVKWVLDHSNGAKIVLWAHNGHVETVSGSMGSALRQTYGDQMVVFEFAFNQGSFQAIPLGGGALRNFTAPPAPAGSLDATLAASGIPLFALDLHAAPKSGPVADWLNTAHKTRSIGAMYSNETASQFLVNQVAPRAADALLFVENTTAARRNPASADPSRFDFKPVAPADAGGLTEYRDPDFDVSLKMPQGWKVGNASRWGDHETTAQLLGPEDTSAGSFYFRIVPRAAPSEQDPYKALLANPEGKVAQRVASGLSDYRIRQGSIERRTVGGRQAVSCIAEFTRNGVAMVEYLTWVAGENALAQFFAQVPSSELEALRHRLDPIIQTLKLP